MGKTKPGDIGTRAETRLVNYLRPNGFGDADRMPRKGNLDEGDVRTLDVCWEVKAGDAARYASDNQIIEWLTGETETERRNSGAVIGCLVTVRWRKLPQDWWVHITADTLAELWIASPSAIQPPGALAGKPLHLTVADWCVLLRAAGYGDPL